MKLELRGNVAQLLKHRSVATWASFIAKALPVFLLPPFIFPNFSSEEAAIWFVFVTLQGMQFLIASSTVQPMMRGFAYALGGANQVRDMRSLGIPTKGGPNMELFSRVWGASTYVHLVVGVTTLAFLAVFGVWSTAPLINQAGTDGLWTALAVFVLSSAIRAYGGHYVSYLQGVDRIPLLRFSEAIFWLLAFVSSLAVLFLGGGLLEIALFYQIPLIANTAWNGWLCRRDQRDRINFQFATRIDREILGQLWPSIWRTGLGTTVFLGTTQGAGLYYATIAEPQRVAVFLFAMSMIRPLGQFAQVPFMTKLPRLARLQAEGKRDAQRQIARRSMMLSYAIHAALVLGVAIALPLVQLLSGFSAELPVLLWLLIGLAGYFERIGSMHLQLCATTNNVLFHWANGLTAVVYVGLTALTLLHLGVFAFPIAQNLALLLVFVPFGLINSYKEFSLPVPSFELHTSVAPLILILASIIIVYIGY